MSPGWGWYFYFFRNFCIAPAVRPAQPRLRWVPGPLSLGAGHGADRPPASIAFVASCTGTTFALYLVVSRTGIMATSVCLLHFHFMVQTF